LKKKSQQYCSPIRRAFAFSLVIENTLPNYPIFYPCYLKLFIEIEFSAKKVDTNIGINQILHSNPSISLLFTLDSLISFMISSESLESSHAPNSDFKSDFFYQIQAIQLI